MSDFFVDALNGNDSNNGTTWALAKKTLAQGLACVPDANGGHRVVVAPGVYQENITNPPYAGTSSAYNEIVFDPWGQIADGSSAKSGRTGWCYWTGASATGYALVWTTSAGNFWRIKNCMIGPYKFIGSNYEPIHVTGAVGLEFHDCVIFDGNSYNYIYMAASATHEVLLTRCLVFSSVGLYFQQTETAFVADKIRLLNCALIKTQNSSTGCCVYVYGQSGKYTQIKLVNCFGMALSKDPAIGFVGGGGSTYSKFDATRCVSFAYSIYVSSGVQLGTQTTNFTLRNNGITGWSAQKNPSYLMLPLLGRGLPINEALSYVSAVTDIFGADRSTAAQTPGAVEFIDNYTRIVEFGEYGLNGRGLRRHPPGTEA